MKHLVGKVPMPFTASQDCSIENQFLFGRATNLFSIMKNKLQCVNPHYQFTIHMIDQSIKNSQVASSSSKPFMKHSDCKVSLPSSNCVEKIRPGTLESGPRWQIFACSVHR